MKIVTVTLGQKGGSPNEEGWLILNYSAPEGGRTNIGAPVKRNAKGEMPTWDEIAVLLVANMGRNEWPQEVRTGKTSANVVRLSIPDDLDTIAFNAEWNPSLDQSVPHRPNPDFVVIKEEKF